MKILVTGAAGFIGSHLAERLCRRGDTVVGLDNFNDYYDPARKRANDRRLAAYPDISAWSKPTCATASGCSTLFATERIDRRRPPGGDGRRSQRRRYHPDLYVNVNLNGTQNLLDAARATARVGNFVFASTSSVYGNTEQIPFVESDPCDRPLQPYAAAKRAAEILALQLLPSVRPELHRPALLHRLRPQRPAGHDGLLAGR